MIARRDVVLSGTYRDLRCFKVTTAYIGLLWIMLSPTGRGGYQ